MEASTEQRVAVDALNEARTELAAGWQYYDANLNVIWVTSVPKDDEAAIAYFHSLMRMSEGFRPKYVARRQLDGSYKALKVTFDCDTFTTEDRR
jgi:hypothetical protein